MKLSDKTRKILSNFAEINSGMLILEGQTQKTMNINRTLLATAVFDETFPKEFGIYSLPKFLSIMSLFKDPELTFGDKTVTFSEGDVKATYTFCEPKLIMHPPKDREMELKNVKVAVEVSEEILSTLKKSVNVLSSPNLVLVGDGKEIKFIAKDTKNSSADTFVRKIGDTTEEFSYSFDMDHFNVIASSYDVQVDERGMSKWSSKLLNIVYWVPTQNI